jgi:glucosamine-6-phosphate deaminase
MNRSGSITETDSFRADILHIHLYKSRAELAAVIADAVALELRSLISERKRAIGIFASDPSQIEYLDYLVDAADIEWTRVIAFQLDEYLGICETAPQSFRRFILDRLVKRVPVAEFHAIRGEAANTDAVCANYAAVLKSRPPDFAVVRIGEDGSLGSLSPSVCDFNDPSSVKAFRLDDDHRRKVVDDGIFRSIDEAPRGVISLTIPTIMACRSLFAVAQPGMDHDALNNIIEGEINSACPASILRIHRNAHLFLVQDPDN